MKLLVLGSTGATGRLLTTLAIAGGHEVRVLVRDATRTEPGPHIDIVQGDARSAASVAAAMAGVDATISTLGMGLETTPNGLMIDATEAMIGGGRASGSGRVIVLSSWGVGETLRRSGTVMRLLYQAGKKVHNEKADAEVFLRSSELDWTLVYPVMLTNGPATHRVRMRDLDEVTKVSGLPRISRADVAASLLAIAENTAWHRRTVVLDTHR